MLKCELVLKGCCAKVTLCAKMSLSAKVTLSAFMTPTR